MAGLVAAARAHDLGADPVVYEKGSRPGGSMLLSSGFVWRYRDLETFAEQCPAGDPVLHRLLLDRFDGALDWLESLGVELLTRETGNPLTVGARFAPRRLVEVLARDVRLGETTEDPTVLATGGFAVRLARERGLMLRASPWSDGDGLDLARARGAATAGDLEEFYGRNMPDGVEVAEEDFVAASQLYAKHARVVNERGQEFLEAPVSWSENDVVQATARQPNGRAWYLLTEAALAATVRERTVADVVSAASGVPAAGLPFPVDDDIVLGVRVRAAVTHTIGGLRIDERARVLDDEGRPLDGLFAAGVDAGGISTGGYSSGLATALVLGLVAAESALL